MPQLPISAVYMAGTVLLILVLGFALFSGRKALRKSKRQFNQTSETIENLCEGFYRATLDGNLFYANSAFAQLIGFKSGESFLAESDFSSRGNYVEPGRREQFRKLLATEGKVTNFVSQIFRHNSTQKIWISENAWIVRDPATGKPIHYEGSVREISQQIERIAFELRLEKLANNLPGGLFQLLRHADGSFSVPYASTGFCNLLGLEDINGIGDPSGYLHRIHKEDLPDYLRHIRQSALTLEQWSSEFRFIRKKGDTRWLMVTATPEKISNGQIIWHGHVNDVTARKATEKKVKQLAYYDELTGLPNRGAITKRLEKEILVNARKDHHAALLFVDLDNFKTLNDTYGHEMGDRLLRKVAARLQKSCRATDAVGRFGGDEFVVLITDLGKDHDEAIANTRSAASNILSEFSRGFDLGELQHVTSPSIGAVLFGSDRPQASEIIKSADIAMYEAKKNGRNRYVLFDPANLQDVSEQYAIQGQLRSAIENNELFFDFQPQVDADGTITGCEALVRWNHPQRGQLLPNEFVPMAEMCGQITAINKWVVDTAVTTLQRWAKSKVMRDLSLSVNIPSHELRSPEFMANVMEMLREHEIDGTRLTLELTEQGITRNTPEIIRHMNQLKELGIRLSLDDFGTGYSSLSQLNNFPFDQVKIDGVFVSDLENRESSRTLIEAILSMAQALNLDTVAEHVGNEYQTTFLTERGCRKFQGYHFHEPMGELALHEVVKGRTEEEKRQNAIGS